MLKKLFTVGMSAAVCVIIMVAGTAAALAVTYKVNEYDIEFNGEKLIFDQFPVNVEGRILVPMRTIFEAYGADIAWDQENLEVTAVTEEKEIILTVDSKVAYVNGQKKKMDVSAMLINGRTMVPLRFVSEMLDAEVEWNQYDSKVEIFCKNQVDEVSAIQNQSSENNVSRGGYIRTSPDNSNVDKETTEIKSTTGFFSTQQGIKSACYLTCLGMIASNLNGEKIYASDVYAFNGYKVSQHDYFGLLSKLNITRKNSIALNGKASSEKIDTVLGLLKNNPEGVIIRFLNGNQSHYIVCKGFEKGKLIVNDPVGQAYVPLDECWTGYSMCNEYENAIACLALVEAFDKAEGYVRWDCK